MNRESTFATPKLSRYLDKVHGFSPPPLIVQDHKLCSPYSNTLSSKGFSVLFSDTVNDDCTSAYLLSNSLRDTNDDNPVIDEKDSKLGLAKSIHQPYMRLQARWNVHGITGNEIESDHTTPSYTSSYLGDDSESMTDPQNIKNDLAFIEEIYKIGGESNSSQLQEKKVSYQSSLCDSVRKQVSAAVNSEFGELLKDMDDFSQGERDDSGESKFTKIISTEIPCKKERKRNSQFEEENDNRIFLLCPRKRNKCFVSYKEVKDNNTKFVHESPVDGLIKTRGANSSTNQNKT